jgi:ATP-dependent DNA helicase UvrD/PcrA
VRSLCPAFYYMPWNDGLTGTALTIASTEDSPLRVMAGPGTGKSFAMKRRVMRLLEEEECEGARVLVVTFTRTAAADLVSEMRALGVDGCEEIHAGTLHAFCFRLLSRGTVFQFLGRVARPLVTFTTSGVLRFEGAPLLRDLQHQEFGGSREKTRRIRAFEAAWARLQSEQAGWPHDPIDRAFNGALQAWLRFHGAILIGELVPLALRYLQHNPHAEEHDAFDHVIVDEYQDLNKAEQELIEILAANADHVVVGDEDQSIYSFRHANPEGIVEFIDTHPDTHDEALQICRRCPRIVVRMADSLIRNNHVGSLAGTILRPRAANPDGIVRIVQWQDIDQEIGGLATYIQHLVEEHNVLPRDILVLSARRYIGYGIRDLLREAQIPTHSFYYEEALEPEEAQDRFALLTLMARPDDRVAQRFVLGYGSPTSRAGEYRRLRAYCEQQGLSPFEALSSFEEGVDPPNGIAQIRQRYREILAALVQFQGLNGIALARALFPEQEEWAGSMYEAAGTLLAEDDSVDQVYEKLRVGVTQPELPESGDFVRIMSLHKSKGLTSRVVVVAGCVLGLVPFVNRQLTQADQDLLEAEQRRLFYVAITRPTERLVISSSLFIERALAYRLGALVRRRDARAYTSPLLAELGPDAPHTMRGQIWADQNFE